MQFVIELEDGSIGHIEYMYDVAGNATGDRLAAEAVVVRLANGAVLHGSVESYEGLHPVH